MNRIRHKDRSAYATTVPSAHTLASAIQRISFFLILSLLASHARVHAEGLPTNVCRNQFCGLAQQGIWNRFQNGTAVDRLLVPSVYSGPCYQNKPGSNSNGPHYGGFLIDESNGRIFFDGRFGFYQQKNPYAHLSVETARENFTEIRILALHDSFAYSEASDSIAPYRYWLRQDAKPGDLLLVGYFGFSQTILCSLDRNPS